VSWRRGQPRTEIQLGRNHQNKVILTRLQRSLLAPFTDADRARITGKEDNEQEGGDEREQ
jgi:hypothetical protein